MTIVSGGLPNQLSHDHIALSASRRIQRGVLLCRPAYRRGPGDKVAIECGDRRVTYRELFESVNQVGNALKKLGVRPEERVFLLLLDTPEFAASFFGAIKIGAVPVPVNTLLKPADYEFLLNNSRARVVIVSDSLFPLLQAIPAKNLCYVEHFIVVGGADAAGAHSFDAGFATVRQPRTGAHQQR